MIEQPPYLLQNVESLPSPSLVIFRDLVASNLDSMIRIVGDVDRLRPHAKTHKSADVVRMARERGIEKHKCATIAEAEMLAEAGVADVLLAYPLVGPNLVRFGRLREAYPSTIFRATVDATESARALSEVAGSGGPIPTLLDLDVGMGRTGIQPGTAAIEVYQAIEKLPGLTPDGLHVYDGHLTSTDAPTRIHDCRNAESRVLAFRQRLASENLPAPRLVLGGTPTFPVHAEFRAAGVECSPGTVVYHDYNYQTRYPDLPFTPAALLLTRVVSRPGVDRICLDLGHKAVAADPSGLRAFFPALPHARPVGHSEEHLILEDPAANSIAIGTPFLAIPAHVCPTSALHRRGFVVSDGRVVEEWEVTARDRRLRF